MNVYIRHYDIFTCDTLISPVIPSDAFNKYGSETVQTWDAKLRVVGHVFLRFHACILVSYNDPNSFLVQDLILSSFINTGSQELHVQWPLLSDVLTSHS